MTSIRAATAGDAHALAPLLEALGYPTPPQDIGQRLARLLARPDAGALVAEVSGMLAGLATYQLIELIYRPRPQCRLTALVVDPAHRRRGVATSLVRAVEEVAAEEQCFRIEVTTRQGRDDAIAFYRALGFEARPHRLAKTLGG